LDSLFVCVNVSARQFARAEIVDRVIDAIDGAGLPRSAIHVEITETALVGDLEGTRQVLERLKEAGVKVHVDDFGTGYSSLSYLVRLPVDSLKIDQSFVREITRSRENLEVVRTITQLADNLDLSVIAEGIETPDQLGALRDMVCEFGQGYLFGRPQPPDQLGALVQGRGA
jgi:EAL domain-containing protein (putative c-di-GMP-specific phosphodiesterase class I)